jgi:hypothetical protein
MGQEIGRPNVPDGSTPLVYGCTYCVASCAFNRYFFQFFVGSASSPNVSLHIVFFQLSYPVCISYHNDLVL